MAMRWVESVPEAYPLVSVLRPDGTVARGDEPSLAPERMVDMLRAMTKARLVDERMVMLQRQGRIGFYVGSMGEEAAVVGAAAALQADDWLFPSYRELGAAFLRGDHQGRRGADPA